MLEVAATAAGHHGALLIQRMATASLALHGSGDLRAAVAQAEPLLLTPHLRFIVGTAAAVAHLYLGHVDIAIELLDSVAPGATSDNWMYGLPQSALFLAYGTPLGDVTMPRAVWLASSRRGCQSGDGGTRKAR